TSTIADAAHDFAAGFYWLPPLVPQPVYSGEADPALAPEVHICELTGTTCGAEIATFTTSTASNSETVRWDATAKQYIVNWHTDLFDLKTGSIYRITVRAGDGVLLGFADVQPVATGKDLKNVTTDQVIALVDGRTLPIKFRAETGIVGAILIDPASATVNVGATQQFAARLYDLHGVLLNGPTVTWASSNETVATIGEDGLATASSVGQAMISAAAGTVTGTANLTVMSADNSITASITVTPPEARCNLQVDFSQTSAQSDPDIALARWEWDFNYDGQNFNAQASTTDPAEIVSHVYTTIGNPTVALRVTDANGKQLVVTAQVPVSFINVLPVARAGGPYEFFVGEPITLDGSSSSDENAACGDVLRFDWSLTSNGSYTETGPIVQVSPASLAAAGFVRPANPTPDNTTIRRTAQLRVRDLASTDDPSTFSTSSAALVARVNEPFAVPAVSSASATASCERPALITYKSSSSFHGASPLRSIVMYEWMFIWDGNPDHFRANERNATPVDLGFADFPGPGTYTAGLRVTDDNVPSLTNIASVAVTISIANDAPLAVSSPFNDDGNHFYNVDAGASVTLDGSGSFDPDECFGDQVTTYSWDMNNDGVIGADAIVNPAGVVETAIGEIPRDVRTTSPTFEYRNLGWTPGAQQAIGLIVTSGNATIAGRTLTSELSTAVIRVVSP
ncbi:MAG TPA: PKD domain-containing protein, partial [Gemmatimonadaceae bacterium]|nr:PKD domain-containing protein [Gemmatimonadaceae bacterium]